MQIRPSVRRKRPSLPTTFLSILCLTSQMPLSRYNSDAFLLSPNTRRIPFLTTCGDAAHAAATCTGFGSSCTNMIHSSQPLHRHSDRYRPFKSSMTAESESEVEEISKVDSKKVAPSIPASGGGSDDEVPDVPTLTANGGYTHTKSSRAKISAANKGKVPWNKGKGRSEEVKRKIAEGVRRKNRERFLQKLKDMGVTEEEYEEQKKAERRKKDAERRARKTANGGYTPTEETKAKISKILKKKYAEGGIKRKKSTKPARKGFKHSEETRRKISESLRKKWSQDPEYQAKMKKSGGNASSSRQKISNTLKEKWKDPAFREKMMQSMKNRKSSSGPASAAQRKKISEAMKKKWQNAQYRNKAMKGMEKYRENLPARPAKAKKPSRAATINVDGVIAVAPITKAKKKKSRAKKIKVGSATSVAAQSAKKKLKKKKKKKTLKKKKASVTLAQSAKPMEAPAAETKVKTNLKDDGDISRMREERRDLYDLLYGDEPGATDDEDEEEPLGIGVIDISMEREIKSTPVTGSSSLSFFTGTAELDDENLDDFDPYNLDDY